MSDTEQRSHFPEVYDYFAIKFDCGQSIMLTEDAARELWYQLNLRFKDRKYVRDIQHADDSDSATV